MKNNIHKVKDFLLDSIDDIEKMAREGNTETEIIKALNISNSTWAKYKKELPELKEALERGYKRSIKKVEAALFKAACGYTYDEITTELKTDSKGVSRMVETKRVRKEVQPNVSAIMNILKNKLQGEYDAPEKIDVKGKIEGKSVLSDVPTEDVAKLAAMMLKKKRADDDV